MMPVAIMRRVPSSSSAVIPVPVLTTPVVSSRVHTHTTPHIVPMQAVDRIISGGTSANSALRRVASIGVQESSPISKLPTGTETIGPVSANSIPVRNG